MKKIHSILAISAAILAGAQSVQAAKTFYVMIPGYSSDWSGATPMLSMDHGETGSAMTAVPDKCGWFSYTTDTFTDDVLIYREGDTSREDVLDIFGIGQTISSSKPIPLESMFSAYGSEELYFVTDKDLFINDNDDGWYMIDPEIEGTCSVDQPSDIHIHKTLDRQNPTISSYEICYGADSETACGKDLEKLLNSDIEYYLYSENQEPNIPLSVGQVNMGGIDLTNPYVPNISRDQVTVPPGIWFLFVKINGSVKKVAAFRQSGTVDILTGSDVAALDSNGNIIKGVTHSFNGEIVAGNPSPIYITALLFWGEDKTYTLPDDAVGVFYSVYTDNPDVHLYALNKDGSYSMVDGQNRIVNESGVDTLYVYMDKEKLSEKSNKATIFIGDNLKGATVNFKAGPVLNKVVMGIQPVVQKTSASKSYAIYNMQGQLIKKGLLTDGAQLTVPTSGVYMVRMGNTSSMVKFK